MQLRVHPPDGTPLGLHCFAMRASLRDARPVQRNALGRGRALRSNATPPTERPWAWAPAPVRPVRPIRLVSNGSE